MKVKLFWYRTQKNFHTYIDNYLSGKIHFSHWKDLNDPMEGYFAYYPQRDTIDDLLSEKRNFKVCCFSNNYSNILLWSHYADSHKGVCLEYEIETDRLSEDIQYEIIQYSRKIPQIDISPDTKEQAVYCLSHKLNVWKYEKERRLLSYNSSDDNVAVDRFGRFVSIILGFRFFPSFGESNTESSKITKEIVEHLKSHKSNQPNFEFYKVKEISMYGNIKRCKIKLEELEV